MTLILKPPGRGNWRAIKMTIDRAPDLFAVKVGERIRIGPWLFRVHQVLP